MRIAVRKTGLAMAMLAMVMAGSWTALDGAASPQAPASEPASPEAVVTSLYQSVTFQAGKTVDWEKVKSLFIPQAVIVLRSSPTEMSVFSRDGFVADFVGFIKQAKLEDRGFEEKILAAKTMVSGDIARALVHYAAHVPGSSRPPQEGIDAFSLMKRDGSWRIVSVVNEVIRPGVPVPEELRK